MKVVKWLFKTVIDILSGCFYLFSACTLVMFGIFILYLTVWVFDIDDFKEKVILYGYLSTVTIYFVVKVTLWLIKLYKKAVTLWNNIFSNPNASDEPTLPHH